MSKRVHYEVINTSDGKTWATCAGKEQAREYAKRFEVGGFKVQIFKFTVESVKP